MDGGNGEIAAEYKRSSGFFPKKGCYILLNLQIARYGRVGKKESRVSRPRTKQRVAGAICFYKNYGAYKWQFGIPSASPLVREGGGRTQTRRETESHGVTLCWDIFQS